LFNGLRRCKEDLIVTIILIRQCLFYGNLKSHAEKISRRRRHLRFEEPNRNKKFLKKLVKFNDFTKYSRCRDENRN
ncbi:MAG: hypothetical protein II486_05320, partial [Thermoguttaceae bacterium]|nr:hypothetical protein [Thermoguttaceae bacterium]